MRMLAEHGVRVPGADELCTWVEKAPKLSNPALEEAVAAGGGAGLQKALDGAAPSTRPSPPWAMIRGVSRLQRGPGGDPCADGHRRCFQRNSEALAEDMDAPRPCPAYGRRSGPDAGTKEACLSALSAKGYAPGHVLMVGDALGDLAAAQHADALFYPILVGKEKTSWEALSPKRCPVSWRALLRVHIRNSFWPSSGKF